MTRKQSALNTRVSTTLALFIILLVALVVVVLAFRQPSTDFRSKAAQLTGNQAPSGPHYNLNIIGVSKGKSADMTSGNRIFVSMTGQCKINLSEGGFSVLDANCTDGQAGFQLPNPDPDNDGVTEYSVYARALGTPGGKSTTTTCATDPTTSEVVCSTYQMVLVRGTGKSSFSNVSRDLLYVYVDLNGDGVPERYNLFSDALKDYFWNYDNNGLKLAQLRFYDISSTVSP